MSYKEIVTKAVIGKGKKKYQGTYQITTEETPTTVLGCWIINHNFKATEDKGKVIINGSFDANVWYSYDNDTKTKVATKKIEYTEEAQINIPNDNILGKEIIVRSLKQPTCISAKEEENTINLEIEKELGIEIIGDTKIKISSVEDNEDNWDEPEKTIENINPNYINEEIKK